MSVFQRAVPLALAIFSGVVGGVYTFKPMFDPAAQPINLEKPQKEGLPSDKSPSTEKTQPSA